MLDSERYQEIVFKSVAAEPSGQGTWTLRGNLTLHGQTRPVTVHVTLKDGRYTGEAMVKQTDFGIRPPGKAGVRGKTKFELSSACGCHRKNAEVATKILDEFDFTWKASLVDRGSSGP